MRDAARSLAALNAQTKSLSKETQDQLDAATQRLEAAQADHARVRDRAAEVQRKLLEHRAAVLSAALRRIEDDSSASNSTHLSLPSMSPATATSTTSVSTLSKFDGAHLFAGHVDAAPPVSPRGPVSNTEFEEMQERVRAAEVTAKEAAKKAAELGRDLGLLRLEKAEAETTAALEIQQAEEQTAALRREMAKMERERARADDDAWDKERDELLRDIAERDMQLKELQRRVEASGSKEEQALIEEELETARKTLRGIVRAQRLNVRTTADDGESEQRSVDGSGYSVANMVAAIATHVESLDEGKKSLDKAKREVENQLRDEQSAKEKLLRELDEARQDSDDSLRQVERLEHQLRVGPLLNSC